MADSAKPIHHAADQGYSLAADTYAQGRPDYPPQITAWLTGTLGIDAHTTVVDLGAGTGKFTRYLQQTGARVIAIEPVASMRDQLSAYAPGATILEGSAEALPLADESVDVLVCAQAFHWFATSQALDEIHRVLRPGGRLGLVWNKRDTQQMWVKQLDNIVNAYEGDAPRFHSGKWRDVFPHAGFGPLQASRFAHGHTGTLDTVVINRSLSTSFIAALPPAQKEQVRNDILALIEKTPALKNQQQVTFPYETLAYCAVKR
ncbi:class I SAM-dependent methyltransferase [Advenella mimigardefordensis]|uniref:Putative methyltransferase n=1 Tax=Advenella mimigardefordensis (strain DSM 17166 / LMG 22922 / DPN7) TaxID=1247726 RepID=W0PL53_ADVMD|nr:class I SAM-dependent methyltransferase [Advenella mimigardefordensis]AHG65703.1 putative methyltransferase [Advenella mimigardefordensis DPN7]